MAAGKELFKLWGIIGTQGVEKTTRELKALDSQVRKAQKEIDRLGQRVSDVGTVFTKLFTLPLLAAATASIKFVKDASSLNETISKTGVIFGDVAKEIEAWAETSATKIGQSKQQALDAASTFGIFGKSAGLAGKDLVDFSTQFVELASDFASFFDTEPQEAITAIGAAFRGENEPIRKYGVLLDDATLRQKAFELGLINTTKSALMPQTKILAAQAAILEQSKDAMGDFTRTSAGFANQQRIVAAQVKNISASLGQIFMPVAMQVLKLMSRLVGYTETLIAAWKSLSPAAQRTITGFVVLAAAMGPAIFLIGKFIAWGKILVPLFVALKAGTLSYAGAVAVLQKSVMGITIIVAALVALGWYWYSQWSTMSVQLEALWAKVALLFMQGANSVLQSVTDLVLKGLGLLDKLGGVVPGLSEKIKEATVNILHFKAELFRDLGNQAAYTNAINESAEANTTLSQSLKQAIKDGKEALGVKDADIKKTQLQIDAEKEAAAQAEETAKKRNEFNQNTYDEFARLGKDKAALLELDRLKAVEEATKIGGDVEAVNRLYAGKHKELLAAQADERIRYEQSTIAQLNALKLSELELLEIERDAEVQRAMQLGADTLAVKELYYLKEQEIRDKLRKEEAEKDRKVIEDRLTQASSIGNKLNSVLGKFSDNKLKRLDMEEQRQLTAIQNSKMSEEDKEKAVLKVQEETEKKRREMERERAIREKVAALFNIAINTAVEISKALSTPWMVPIIAALGAAEAVAVATAPLPFYEGGLIKGTEEGVTARIGERNQDEIVFPLERGIGLLLDGITDRLSEIMLPLFSLPAPELAAAGGGTRDIHLHIGTFIGDERGLKQLERKLDTIRIAENQRKGF
jgi:hypothetical protein